MPTAGDLSSEYDYSLDHSRAVTTDDVQLVVTEEFVDGRYQLFFVETEVNLNVKVPVIVSVWCLQYKSNDLAHLALVTDYVGIRLNSVTPAGELKIDQIADEAVASGSPISWCMNLVQGWQPPLPVHRHR